ncbi:MAG: hypothetical protein AAF456_04330 [Planctomycetota bacterium]
MRCAQIFALAVLLVTSTGCLQYYHPDSLSGVNGPGPGGGMLAKYDAVEAAHAWRSYCPGGHNENIFSGFAAIEGSWFNVDCWKEQWESRYGHGFLTPGMLTSKLAGVRIAGGECTANGGIAGLGQIFPGRGLCRDRLFRYRLVETSVCDSCGTVEGECPTCGSCDETTARPGLLQMLRSRRRITDSFMIGPVSEDYSCQCNECTGDTSAYSEVITGDVIAGDIEVPQVGAPAEQIYIEPNVQWQPDVSGTPQEYYPPVEAPQNQTQVVPDTGSGDVPGTIRQLEPGDSSTQYYPNQPYDAAIYHPNAAYQTQPYQAQPHQGYSPDFQQQLVQPQQLEPPTPLQQPTLQQQPVLQQESNTDSYGDNLYNNVEQPVAQQQPRSPQNFHQQIMEPFGVQLYNNQPADTRIYPDQPYDARQYAQQGTRDPDSQQYEPVQAQPRSQMPVVNVEEFEEPQSIIDNSQPTPELQAVTRPRNPAPIELTPNEHGLVIGPNIDFSSADQYSQGFAGDLSEPMEAISASDALPESPMLPDRPVRDFQSISAPDNDPFDNYDVDPIQEAPPINPEEMDNPFNGDEDPFGSDFPVGRNRRPVQHVAGRQQPIVLRARPTANHSMSAHSRQILEQEAQLRAASVQPQPRMIQASSQRRVDEFGLPAGDIEFHPLPQQNFTSAPERFDAEIQPEAPATLEFEPQTSLIPPVDLEQQIRDEVNRQLRVIEESRQMEESRLTIPAEEPETPEQLDFVTTPSIEGPGTEFLDPLDVTDIVAEEEPVSLPARSLAVEQMTQPQEDPGIILRAIPGGDSGNAIFRNVSSSSMGISPAPAEGSMPNILEFQNPGLLEDGAIEEDVILLETLPAMEPEDIIDLDEAQRRVHGVSELTDDVIDR